MARTYADAIASLNTLQTNFAIVDAIRKSGKKMNEQAIPEMVEWCRKIGYDPAEFDKLNVIHIAGTKGKGSTAAFVSSILTQYLGQSGGNTTKTLNKVGLYTSPHLRFVRERIQINGEPLSEEQFTKYFFETWDRLEDAASNEGSDPKSSSAKPVYFRFLTLMAFHTYIREGVDAAIIECGIGGAYDSTNILQRPAVTGITTLGIDHVGVLGATVAEIAWHKAGIIKPGSICYTPNSQQSDTKPVLEKVAQQQGSQVIYTQVSKEIADGEIKLGLQAEFQKTNAALAVAVAKDWLDKQQFGVDQNLIVQGLEKTRWPGRCETRTEKGISWCIDGGHTLDSIEVAGKWFASVLQTPTTPAATTTSSEENSQSNIPYRSRYLIFNQQTRDASALAKALHSTLSSSLSSALSSSPTSAAANKSEQPFTHAIFCTNTTYQSTGFRPDLVAVNINTAEVEELTVQRQLAQTWKQIDPDSVVHVVRTIEEAVEIVRADAAATFSERLNGSESKSENANDQTTKEVIALVTGSLHLVGGFLEVIEGGKKA